MPKPDKCFKCFIPNCGERYSSLLPLRLHMVFCPHKETVSVDILDSQASNRNQCIAYKRLLSIFKLDSENDPNYTKFNYANSRIMTICKLLDNFSFLKDSTNDDFLNKFINNLRDLNTFQQSTEPPKSLFNFNNIHEDIENFLSLQALSEENILHIDHITRLPSDGSLVTNKFKKHCGEVDGVRFDYYMIDPEQLIRNQFSTVQRSDLFIDHDEDYGEWSPITSELGAFIIPSVQSEIKSSSQPGVNWFDVHSSKDLVQSMVGLCQLYSDKSATTLNIGGVSFHPLHLTLLNFKKKVREKLISCGLTILGFLPTSFLTNVNYPVDNERWVKDNSMHKTQKMKILNRIILETLHPLFDSYLIGMKAKTQDGHNFNIHVLPSNYCADILEAKDHLRVKHGQLTLQPCFRCHIFNSQLAVPTSSALRRLSTTQKTLSFRDSALTLWSEKRHTDPPLAKKFKDVGNLAINGISQHPQIPIFSEFDFVSKKYIINPYQIFTVEPLHVFHLGISKLLKECMCEKLKCKLKKSRVLGKDRSVFVNVSSFRTAILRHLNGLVDSVSGSSDGLRVCTSIQKDDSRNGLSGFFGVDGLTGMIEATHMKQIDNISPFFGALVDRCSDDVGTFPVTLVFSLYVKIMNQVLHSEYSRDRCLKSLSSDLANDIKHFKENTYKVFSNYQASRLGTVKWHLLDHIPLDILQLGSLNNCDANFYEQSHKIFKFYYNSATNKRSSTCVQDTIKNLSESLTRQLSAMQMYYDLNDNDSKNKTYIEVKNTGINRNVRHWYSTSLDSFSETLRLTFKAKKCSTTLSYQEMEFQHYLNHIGETAATTLFQCINEVADDYAMKKTVNGRVNIKFSKTAYISNRQCPTLDNVDDTGVATINDSKVHSVTRITATNTYYGSEMGRYDSVFLRSTSHSDKQNAKEEIWFGQILSLITLETTCKYRNASMICCALHNRPNCSICAKQHIGTYTFVQYYDIVTHEALPIDNVEKTLNCIRLKWARSHDDVEDHMDSGKQYGLCHIESIMGLVHVLPAMEILKPLNENSSYKSSATKNIGPLDRWEGHLFYVNRFYRDNSLE